MASEAPLRAPMGRRHAPDGRSLLPFVPRSAVVAVWTSWATGPMFEEQPGPPWQARGQGRQRGAGDGADASSGSVESHPSVQDESPEAFAPHQRDSLRTHFAQGPESLLGAQQIARAPYRAAACERDLLARPRRNPPKHLSRAATLRGRHRSHGTAAACATVGARKLVKAGLSTHAGLCLRVLGRPATRLSERAETDEFLAAAPRRRLRSPCSARLARARKSRVTTSLRVHRSSFSDIGQLLAASEPSAMALRVLFQHAGASQKMCSLGK